MSAARRAYDAALRVPDAFAYNLSPGSGGYGDVALSDEFYWAATELYLTTGQARYGADMRNSRTGASPRAIFSWSRVDTLGTISLAIAGDGDDQARARAPSPRAARRVADESAGQGYRIPFNRSYVWGSNADLA
ncbi:MAG: glycoside hydrolase family 9 protein, partial [Terricaulis sp.]|nr:glycoside hydrolase family 9 protein [Terricaulis sp.]